MLTPGCLPSTLLQGTGHPSPSSAHIGRVHIPRRRAPQKHHTYSLSPQNIWRRPQPTFCRTAQLSQRHEQLVWRTQDWGTQSTKADPLLLLKYSFHNLSFCPSIAMTSILVLQHFGLIHGYLPHICLCSCIFILRTSFLPTILTSISLSLTSFGWGLSQLSVCSETVCSPAIPGPAPAGIYPSPPQMTGSAEAIAGKML